MSTKEIYTEPYNFGIDDEFRDRVNYEPTEWSDIRLSADIAQNGVTDPLITATFSDGEGGTRTVLMDGHRRLRIATELGLEFEAVDRGFRSREEALYQLDVLSVLRRNLNGPHEHYVRGRVVNYERAQGQSYEQSAKAYGVSESTVRRQGEFADSMDRIHPDLHSWCFGEPTGTANSLACVPLDDQKDMVEYYEAGAFTSIEAAIIDRQTPKEEPPAPAEKSPEKPKAEDKAEEEIEEDATETPVEDDGPPEFACLIENCHRSFAALKDNVEVLHEHHPEEHYYAQLRTSFGAIAHLFKMWEDDNKC